LNRDPPAATGQHAAACAFSFEDAGLRLAVGAGWNNRNGPRLFERPHHPLVGIVDFVGEESPDLQAWQQGVGTDQIVDLPRREMDAG
jgi:hypothetical protein